MIKGVFSSPFIPKSFEFSSIILHNGTKCHANFFGKKVSILHFKFWNKEAKKYKKASRGSNESNKFCIWDETKHNLENFGILYFIILK